MGEKIKKGGQPYYSPLQNNVALFFFLKWHKRRSILYPLNKCFNRISFFNNYFTLDLLDMQFEFFERIMLSITQL